MEITRLFALHCAAHVELAPDPDRCDDCGTRLALPAWRNGWQYCPRCLDDQEPDRP